MTARSGRSMVRTTRCGLSAAACGAALRSPEFAAYRERVPFANYPSV